jgi:hypothetical protein
MSTFCLVGKSFTINSPLGLPLYLIKKNKATTYFSVYQEMGAWVKPRYKLSQPCFVPIEHMIRERERKKGGS